MLMNCKSSFLFAEVYIIQIILCPYVCHFVLLSVQKDLNNVEPKSFLHMSYKIIEALTNKVLIPFRLVPKEGLTPEKLAFSVTLGIISGIFPVLGMTTLLSIILTMLFRQNLLVVQSVQWILALAQILLIIPFMQFGAFLLNQNGIHINMQQINHAFQSGFFPGIKTVGLFHLYGILTWFILVIPAGAASYFGFLFVFQQKGKKAL